ncbi:hypothetical protein ACFRJ8_19945 [Arthrobacter sp. NPDC056886]|uniref:hypothetical protein n=1 Tax=Arthrobacter sp. NPDC056886 TaxID=3345960 RepID=UPI00366AA38F
MTSRITGTAAAGIAAALLLSSCTAAHANEPGGRKARFRRRARSVAVRDVPPT